MILNVVFFLSFCLGFTEALVHSRSREEAHRLVPDIPDIFQRGANAVKHVEYTKLPIVRNDKNSGSSGSGSNGKGNGGSSNPPTPPGPHWQKINGRWVFVPYNPRPAFSDTFGGFQASAYVYRKK